MFILLIQLSGWCSKPPDCQLVWVFRYTFQVQGSSRPSSAVCCHLLRGTGTCAVELLILSSCPNQISEFKLLVPIKNYAFSSSTWVCIRRNEDQWSQCGDGEQQKYLSSGGTCELYLFSAWDLSVHHQSILTCCLPQPHSASLYASGNITQ